MQSITLQNILPLLLFASTGSHLVGTGNGSSNTVAAQTATPVTNTVSDSLDGAWVMVWSKTNGVIDKLPTPNQLKIFHNGFFAFVMTIQQANGI